MSSAVPRHVLRPHGATVLSIVAWVVLGALALEALISAGIGGIIVYPGLALIAVLVWAVLWAPRLLLLPEGVEVRNPLHTYTLPFARIQEVRLGAMVHFDVDELRGRARRVTAWNAPGIGRDNPLARADASPSSERGSSTVSGPERRRRLSRAERLRRDQSASRSALVRARWEDWHEQHPGGGSETAGRTLNVVVLAVVGAVLLANAVMLLL